MSKRTIGIELKSPDQIESMRVAGLVVAKGLAQPLAEGSHSVHG